MTDDDFQILTKYKEEQTFNQVEDHELYQTIVAAISVHTFQFNKPVV